VEALSALAADDKPETGIGMTPGVNHPLSPSATGSRLPKISQTMGFVNA
jgi:hypothetical protein